MIFTRNNLIILLFALLALSTAPIFANAELLGKGPQSTQTVTVAEPVWQSESTYWSEEYPSRPYYQTTRTFTIYEPAYKYGYNAYSKDHAVAFDKLDMAKLKADWEAQHVSDQITWDEALPAIRDSYTRVYEYYNANGDKTTVIEKQ